MKFVSILTHEVRYQPADAFSVRLSEYVANNGSVNLPFTYKTKYRHLYKDIIKALCVLNSIIFYTTLTLIKFPNPESPFLNPCSKGKSRFLLV
jgi:hypothetical protein